MLKNNSQSIQKLLVAENKAEEKINQARKRKALKLKQAKVEAQLEIDKFRQENEQIFKEHEAQYLASQEGTVLKIERDTEKELKEMEKYVKLNKDAVIDYLLNQTFAIECQVHENFRHDIV